jgi:uncharacterized protein
MASRKKTPSSLDQLIDRLDKLVARAESLLPGPRPRIDWRAPAFRWKRGPGGGHLVAIKQPQLIRMSDLQDIDAQKALVDANTRQFLEGLPANNVLLTGARGTGKSSLVKAMLDSYAERGLRLIEVDKAELVDLSEIVDLVRERPERFIVYCDDLSFSAGEAAYKSLKTALEGSLSARVDNLLIYATSNRRHLMPEYMQENIDYEHVGEEIHPGEATEEKISLSERFGLWVSFHSFTQEEYLSIATHWLRELGTEMNDAARTEALQWALQRGARSGRVAAQFARDWAGRHPSRKKK